MAGRRRRSTEQTEGQEQFLFSLDLAEFAEPAGGETAAEADAAQPTTSQPPADAAPSKTPAPAPDPGASGPETSGPEAPGQGASTPRETPRPADVVGKDAEAEPHEEAMTRAERAASRRQGPEYLLDRARRVFHRALIDERVLVTRPGSGVPSNADTGSGSSLRYARAIAEGIGAVEAHPRSPGHSAGRSFERAVAAYLQAVLQALDGIRPGEWTVRRLGDRGADGTIRDASEIFEQYEHLAALREIVEGSRDLRAVLGAEADLLAPDVVVMRSPLSDRDLNAVTRLVDPLGPLASASPLRSAVQPKPLLHAVVSCRWTLRSDRAQQAKAEAQQLIRNRRGRAPHLVMVTGEPMPSRLAAVALGTGELDCVYHFALHELMDAIDPAVDPAGAELMHTMVQGRRLRDISDLPLDLAI
ncbi:NgoMIV family type II restriction endonuclease [Rothia kristinae]|uniref:NgoMIV family type II restriction endonuclease n=1 Tax=Rothia kristinae TaxID=37923 RepID=UPI0009E50D32|nr:NgoMIV family type II restriction endonuclease [Rothia kristinae]